MPPELFPQDCAFPRAESRSSTGCSALTLLQRWSLQVTGAMIKCFHGAAPAAGSPRGDDKRVMTLQQIERTFATEVV
jgi:hypothetical protein